MRPSGRAININQPLMPIVQLSDPHHKLNEIMRPGPVRVPLHSTDTDLHSDLADVESAPGWPTGDHVEKGAAQSPQVDPVSRHLFIL